MCTFVNEKNSIFVNIIIIIIHGGWIIQDDFFPSFGVKNPKINNKLVKIREWG